MADILFEYLQYEVVDFFASGFLLTQGNAQARDPLKDAQTAQILYKSGIVSRNEARLDIGKEVIDSAKNTFVDGTQVNRKLNEKESAHNEDL